MLPAQAGVLQIWQPPGRWCELLHDGVLDAALISVAAMAGSGALQQPPRSSPGISAVPLGRRPLVLLHAHGGDSSKERERSSGAWLAWQLLLPPALVQPLLWRQLQRLALLPLRASQTEDDERLLVELRQGPHLLPGPLCLLEELPWRDAGVRAVPPPEPLEEMLWLLVREGEQAHPATVALVASLQGEVRRGHHTAP